MLNRTHDPARISWIDSANEPSADFPLQNLPFGVFRSGAGAARIGVAIGREVLDLAAAAEAGLLPPAADSVCRQASLNALLAAGPAVWTALRDRLSELLGTDTCSAGLKTKVQSCLLAQADVRMILPA